MSWYLNNALTTFRKEVDAAYPGRDKTSDGTIGDEAHQGGSSDHNPDSDESVDAWDMDVEVNGKSAAYREDVEYLKAVFEQHPAAQYWIHDREIANKDVDNWARRYYSGSNPHDKHVHWNSDQSHEDSTQPWGVKGAGVSKQEVIDGLHQDTDWEQPSIKERMDAAGWGHMSLRELTEYCFEWSREANEALGRLEAAVADLTARLPDDAPTSQR